MTEKKPSIPTRRARKPVEVEASNEPEAAVEPDTEAQNEVLEQAQAQRTRKRKWDKPAAGPTEPLFATAPDQVMQIKGMKMPDMQRGFQTIVTDLFESGFDPVAEYRKVLASLEITDALTPERMKRAANSAEKIANDAHQLYIVAKVEVSTYTRETEGIYGAMRERATMELEKEKATGVRTKQITEADVTSAAASLFPDEWSEICTRRDRAAAMLKQLENLAGLARSRCYTVNSMANPGGRYA